MRVLFLNRADSSQVPGGDTVQMNNTRAGLERLGVEVCIGSVEDIRSVPAYDLVHIFNWQQLGPILDHWPKGRTVSNLILSPIFWFHTGHWFEEAAETKRIWKMLRKAIGKVRAGRLYETWQQAKFTRGSEGQNLREKIFLPDRLLPNSKIETDHLENVLGVARKLQSRASVVPNGVVRELFDPLPGINESFFQKYGLEGFVLEVARIQAAKNQLGLIEALFDVPVPIVFVGQPSPYETDYVARCYERGRQRGNVYFTGPMKPEELAGVYALAAVHVLPSWRETPGLSSLEAAAAGCRVVTTSIGSAREYFEEEAWYCDPRNPQSIRNAVINALKAPSSRQLRERVLNQFTWDAAAQATHRAYCMALENPKGN